MNKKNMVIVVLATLCLTLIVLSMIPVMSAPAYDPWLDVNESGSIDVKDYQIIKNAIPSVGDPTKNVTVTNWPTNKLAYYFSEIMLPSQYVVSDWIAVSEYSKIVVCIHTQTAMSNEYRLVASTNALTFELYVDTQINFGENLYKVYDTPNEQVHIRFSNNAMVELTFTVTVYLIP